MPGVPNWGNLLGFENQTSPPLFIDKRFSCAWLQLNFGWGLRLIVASLPSFFSRIILSHYCPLVHAIGHILEEDYQKATADHC
ncbi:uncharacterized protein SPAPADRAFT_58332 [Spathaspora passalidarum NRRL Y-27907]|uniref:Uncharacterized protein n=1 Tax=Spathaspora passalidarum (strain NRRL Y-27907 / 11-Y1) TaxID=619300 RepID=G3AG06_SPAPN|nr:uncharacterized protein SPAPADRAFT_58332 [Spathaspora passalidarum NRRL Y-27907]EGW35145.1 hypothetical protein SPAPADRAFT_58332 [Spathaspora passalidarum NRRL Y-27907]